MTITMSVLHGTTGYKGSLSVHFKESDFASGGSGGFQIASAGPESFRLDVTAGKVQPRSIDLALHDNNSGFRHFEASAICPPGQPKNTNLPGQFSRPGGSYTIKVQWDGKTGIVTGHWTFVRTVAPAPPQNLHVQ